MNERCDAMRLVRLLCAVVAVGLLGTGQAQAQTDLLLFSADPATTIADGGPGDASGGPNDMIVIDPASPVPVPGTTDLYFSGMVEYLPAGTFTVGGVAGLRAIRITGVPAGSGLPGAGQPATLTNTGSTTITFTDPVLLATYNYASLHPAGSIGTADLFIDIDAALDTAPTGGSIANVGQRIEFEVRASTLELFSTPGVLNSPVSAAWNNTLGTVTGPIAVTGSDLEAGSYDASLGRIAITLNSITLGPGEHYQFPDSMVAGVVPEPGTLALLLAGGAWLLPRRRRA